ncbi:hypothetical protein FOMPIDRAFT_93761 [Fomitopsis schrenkii]|uniref:Uncharacterized protein n=1 Tax=Fomitopsis schrenkii TaxID=2126942 RepID=S8F6C3_FOMSC|nr:hypothetical protein FOMPIDRAFT_93761 [Fomitopsis schrenkii]
MPYGESVAHFASSRPGAGEYLGPPPDQRGANTSSDEGTAVGPYGITTTEQLLEHSGVAGSGICPSLAPELAPQVLDAPADDPCQRTHPDLSCTCLDGSYSVHYVCSGAPPLMPATLSASRPSASSARPEQRAALLHTLLLQHAAARDAGITHFQKAATAGYGYDVLASDALARLMIPSFIRGFGPECVPTLCVMQTASVPRAGHVPRTGGIHDDLVELCFPPSGWEYRRFGV